MPLQPGDGDGAVQQAFDTLLVPLARAFKPQLVLVSAGYDPQEGDPLGDLRFSQTSFQWMAARLVAACRGGGRRRSAVLPRGRLLARHAGRLGGGHRQGAWRESRRSSHPAVSADERADVREALEEVKPYWKGVF